MKVSLCFLLIGLAAADPARPHLAKAWTAASTGDGLPGATGQESYLYIDDPEYSQSGGLRAHLYDYGTQCRKLTVNQFKPTLIERSFYLNCKGINCCYKDNDIMKKWDFHDSHLLQPVKVSYKGMTNTTELGGAPVLAEHWHEEDNVAFGAAKVTYDYFITRKGEDVITHRIDFGASGVDPGSILYANFTVQHNLTQFASTFDIPAECQQTIQCPDAHDAEWGVQPKK